LEDDVLGDFFDLERGNAQGDTISPFCFNLGYQILLFKINFDLLIGAGAEPPEQKEDSPPLPPAAASFIAPEKVMAMADDATCIVQLDKNTGEQLKRILSDFELLSGLECNVEKSTLMIIGNDNNTINELGAVGFDEKDEITLLGMYLSNKDDILEKNAEIITNKLLNQSHYWSRFNLSLPGRIAIAKTMMYSQLNYLGSFLNFDAQSIKRWEEIIGKFVSGKMNIAKDRIFKEVSEGGMGLFPIEIFLQSQKLGWIRLAQSLDKHWKIRLFYAGNGDVFEGRASQVNKKFLPVTHEFCKTLDLFRSKLITLNENYKKVSIIDNIEVKQLFGMRRTFGYTFFGEILTAEEQNRIAKLCTGNILTLTNRDVPVPKSLEAVREATSQQLTEARYRILLDSILDLHNKYKKVNRWEQKEESLGCFLKKIRKGSKKIRKILEINVPNESISNNVIRFGEITETIPNVNNSKIMNSIWNASFLENSIRVFAFKLYNNNLGINSRIAHFVPGKSSNCTFCDIAGAPEAERETITHLFQDCELVERTVLDTIRWFWSHISNSTNRTDYFCGISSDNKKHDTVWNITTLLIKWYIWDCKLKYKVPVLNNLRQVLCNKVNNYCKINKVFRTAIRDTERMADIFELG
jgi:hypothetical protein